MTKLVVGIVVLLISVPIGNVYAQGAGQLTGTVKDTSGAVVARSQISATNVETGIRVQTTSNETGTYLLPELAAGVYDVTCQLDGFKTAERKGMVIETRFVHTLDFALEVGQPQERVEVTATAPLLNQENSTIGQFVDRDKLMGFPLRSRQANEMISLAPGVVSSAPDNSYVSIGGGKPREQYYQIDGIVGIYSILDLSEAAFNLPAESVQEYRVESNSYTGDVGRTSGGEISETTRSGTNQFHGSAYEFFRNNALDSRSFFAAKKEELRYNIPGASLGGPIIRNKFFFFVNNEYQKQIAGATSLFVVPNPLDRTGNFSQRSGLTVLDPATKQPFPGNIVPGSRIDPVAAKLLSYYPLPNLAIDPTKAPGANYRSTANNVTYFDTLVARFDYNRSDKDRFFARSVTWIYDQTPALFWPQGITAATPGTPRYIDQNYYQFAGSWVRTFTPTLVNDFRPSMLVHAQNVQSAGYDSGVAGKVGLNNVDPNNFPELAVTGLTTLGDFRHNWWIDERGPTVQDTLTWIKGKHELKMGFDYIHGTLVLNDTSGTTSGYYTFSSRATNEGLATFLLGWTSAASTLAQKYTTYGAYWGSFITDNWKLSSRFTVSVGLRWEYDAPPSRSPNAFTAFNPNAINPVFNTPGVVTFAPFPNSGNSPYAPDLHNFGPRVGLAWRPKDTWVVRAGYAISYDKPYRDIGRGTDSGYAQQRTFTSVDGGFTPVFPLSTGMPPLVAQPHNASFGAAAPGQLAFFSPEEWNPVQRAPMVQQWDLSIQKQLPGSSMAEIGYMANVGHRLYTSQDFNLDVVPLVNGLGPATQSVSLLPYPQYTAVNIRYPTWANSSYHTLVVKYEKRYSKGVTVISNYTFSKTLDNATMDNALGAAPSLRYIYLMKLDKSYSGQDMPHRFVAAVVWDLPFGRDRAFATGNRALDSVIGGWSVAPFLERHSGVPWGPTTATDLTNTFAGSNRPNAVANPVLSGGRSTASSLAQWFNTSAFVAPGVGVFGNAARTYCCGPGYFDIDAFIQRVFSFTERWKLQFRSDFFNFTNHANFGIPSATQGTGTFGQITSLSPATTPRQIQFGVRLQF